MEEDTSDGEGQCPESLASEDIPSFEGQIVFKGDFHSSDDS